MAGLPRNRRSHSSPLISRGSVACTQCRNGLARRFHGEFFDSISFAGRTVVHAITSPENTGSIEFNRRMGLRVLDGDGEIEGIPVLCHDDGPGGAHVRFARELG